MAIFTTPEELAARIGAQRVAQLFDDDGDGVADTANVDAAMALADDWVVTFLEGKGFNQEQLESADVRTNKTLRGAATDLFAGFGGERKPEWRNEQGEGVCNTEMKRGKEMLKMLAQGGLRIPKAGPRTNISGRVSAPNPPFVIASSSSNRKGPGGF